MFAVMRETEYYNKQMFRDNFWNDWRKILGKNHVIKNLDDCDFSPIYEWYMQEKEIKKQMSAEVNNHFLIIETAQLACYPYVLLLIIL